MGSVTFHEALKRLQDVCSRREKCSRDIVLKLKSWNIPDEESLKIIKELKKDKFLDDSRFAVFFARDKSRISKWGKEKIRFALKAKYIDSGIIENALNELDESNDEVSVREILGKKMLSVKYSDRFELKGKLIRFGMQRGFPYTIVNKVAEDLIKH